MQQFFLCFVASWIVAGFLPYAAAETLEPGLTVLPVEDGRGEPPWDPRLRAGAIRRCT
jgi:hypothetical protein